MRLIFCLLLLMSSYVFAGELSGSIRVKYGKPIKLSITDKAMNRIGFGGHVISKIIGDNNSINSIVSDNGSELFLTSKVVAGKMINISVLLTTGDIVDLTLEVIKRKEPTFATLVFNKTKDLLKKSEAVKMIETMSSRSIGKYYVQQIREIKNLPNHKDIKLIQKSSYRYKKIQGLSLLIENRGNKSVTLTEEDIYAGFDNILAVYIDQKELAPRKSTDAYVVFKRLGS